MTMTRLARIAAAFLAVATVLFVIGAFVERDSHSESEESEAHTEVSAGASESASAAGESAGEAGESAGEAGESAGEAGESAEERAAEAGRETATEKAGETGTEAGGEAHDESSEFKPLGINIEEPALIIVAGVVSLLVAGLVATRARRATLIVLTVLAAAFAVLEVAEVAHQIDVERWGLTIVAAGALITHALAALFGLGALRRASSSVTV